MSFLPLSLLDGPVSPFASFTLSSREMMGDKHLGSRARDPRGEKGESSRAEDVVRSRVQVFLFSANSLRKLLRHERHGQLIELANPFVTPPGNP